MGWRANLRPRRWVWMVGVVVVVVLIASGGVAARALNNRSGDGHVRHRLSIAPATASAAAKTHKGRRPKPTTTSAPTTTTTSVSTTTTVSASSTSTTLPPATPGSDVKIPLAGFGDMLVDQGRGRIYISGGKGSSGIVVTDLQGNHLRTLEGIAPGAAGMTLSPDGTKVYVAASDSDGITIIDASTYDIGWYWTGTSLGEPTCPRDVAVASGQLWFSWGCDGGPVGIGRVNPETRAHELHAYTADTKVTSPPLLATLPSQPNMLIAGESGTNPASLFRFEATPTGLEQRVWRRTDGGSVLQLVVTPDGSQVIVPSGYPYYHPVLRTSDLTEVHRYPTTAYPNAAAVRPDGVVAAGINGAYDEDVYIFEPGGSTPIATYEFGHLPGQETWAHTLVNGGLAWAGDRIYAITEQLSEPDNLTLRIRVVG